MIKLCFLCVIKDETVHLKHLFTFLNIFPLQIIFGHSVQVCVCVSLPVNYTEKKVNLFAQENVFLRQMFGSVVNAKAR